MIDELLERALSGGGAAAELLRAHRAAVVASAGGGSRRWVAEAEEAAARDPSSAFAFGADGHATLAVGPRRYAAGRFETPALKELRAAAIAARRAGPLRVFVLDGASPVTDIGALQAFAPPDTLFQVASQFNCLEAPDACIVPVSDYLHDPTQGPRAAVSCFPGALLRHHAAPGPGGARFTQIEDGAQVNLLEAVCAPGVARVQNGYLMDQNIDDPVQFARWLDERFDDLRVGLHTGLEVVLGYAWDGSVPGAPQLRIAQALTSTLAGGGYSAGRLDAAWFDAVCVRLQRAAQLGTLLGAVAAGAKRAVLTLIGGGVFGNRVPLIWEAILWAADEVARTGAGLDVVVNGRNLGRHVPWEALLRDTVARGGTAIETEAR